MATWSFRPSAKDCAITFSTYPRSSISRISCPAIGTGTSPSPSNGLTKAECLGSKSLPSCLGPALFVCLQRTALLWVGTWHNHSGIILTLLPAPKRFPAARWLQHDTKLQSYAAPRTGNFDIWSSRHARSFKKVKEYLSGIFQCSWEGPSIPNFDEHENQTDEGRKIATVQFYWNSVCNLTITPTKANPRRSKSPNMNSTLLLSTYIGWTFADWSVTWWMCSFRAVQTILPTRSFCVFHQKAPSRVKHMRIVIPADVAAILISVRERIESACRSSLTQARHHL